MNTRVQYNVYTLIDYHYYDYQDFENNIPFPKVIAKEKCSYNNGPHFVNLC